MNAALTAILITFLAAFVAEKVVLALCRIFGIFAIVQERTCRVYVLFGKVTSGMKVVDKINTDGSTSGVPPKIVQRMLSVTIHES